nr:reverse transcriptase domain-containing protein [Tanacetum cinerariifolium]
MLLVTQIDTFYNGLTLRYRDTINAAAGGTFLKKRPKECYDLIENMIAHYNHWDTSATRDETSRTISSTTNTKNPEVVRQLEKMNKNFQDMMKQIQSVKSMNPKCETCGRPYSFTKCPAIGGYTQEAAYATKGNHNSGVIPTNRKVTVSYHSNNYLGPPGFNQPNAQNNQNQGYNWNRENNFNQGNYHALNNQVQAQPLNELSYYMKINETDMRAMQNQITTMRTKIKNDFETSMAKQHNELKNMMTSFIQMHNPLGLRSFPSNTVANL